MSKVTIEFEDQESQVAINTTITGFDEDSNACKISERVMFFIDRIAERQGKPELAPKLITAAEESVKRLKHSAPQESVIILAH